MGVHVRVYSGKYRWKESRVAIVKVLRMLQGADICESSVDIAMKYYLTRRIVLIELFTIARLNNGGWTVEVTVTILA